MKKEQIRKYKGWEILKKIQEKERIKGDIVYTTRDGVRMTIRYYIMYEPFCYEVDKIGYYEKCTIYYEDEYECPLSFFCNENEGYFTIED